MFCEKCGRPIPEGQRSCSFCDPVPQEPVLAVPKFERAPMDLSAPVKKAPASAPTFQPPMQTPAYEPPTQTPSYEAPVQIPAFTPPVQAVPDEAPAQTPSFTPPVPAYEAPAYEVSSYEAPAQPAAQPAFVLNTPAESSKPKRRNGKGGKGGKIALAIAALLLVVGVVLTVIFWGSISRFFTRTFGDPAEYLQDVEKENVAAVAGDVAVAYDEALGVLSSNGTSVDTTVTLEVSDTLRSLLGSMLTQNDIDMDLSWVKSIVLAPQIDVYEDTLRMDVGVGVNGVNIATVSAIWDTTSQSIYIGVPELNATYIQIDATELLGAEVDSVAEAMAMSRVIMGAFVEAMPESDQVEELINRYAGIIIEGISEAEKETKTVKVGSLKQDLLVVTAELSQKDILKIAAEVLETAQDDELVEEIIVNFEDSIADISGQPIALYDVFAESADMALDELDYMIDDAETSTFLTIDTYFDSKDEIVGRTFTVEYEDEEVSAHYITVTEGGKWAFEAEMDTLTVSGKGTIKNDTRNGSYTLSVDGVDLFTLEVEDCVCTEEQFTGTFRLIPESAVYEMMDVDSSVSGVLNQAALKLVVAEDSVSVGIEAAGTQFVAIVLSGEIAEASQITLPAGVSTDDDAAGMKWITELNFDAVLSNMEKAGVPSQYMDMAKQLVEAFRSEFG